MIAHTDDPARVLVSFGHALREHGIRVSPAEIVTFGRAVSLLGADDLEDLYWSGRSCLVSEFVDIPAYDAAFASFFLGSDQDLSPESGEDPEGPLTDAAGSETSEERTSFADSASVEDAGGDSEQEEDDPDPGAVASLFETLRHRSFSEWSEEEKAYLARLIGRIEVRVPRRCTRRRRPAPTGNSVDLRRTVRRALQTEGEVLRRSWRRRVLTPRRLLLLVDVSGSMSTQSRAMLHLAYGLVTSTLDTEVFCFGTRLTRTTDLLAGHDPDLAVQRASAGVVDWAGGTRIGESLASLLRDPISLRHARGAVVLVASDGLETGDPELMAEQVARLSRLAYTVVWMSPLKSDPSYRPLTRGMRLAFPHLDHLVAADSLGDLERVATLLPRLVSGIRTP